MSLVGGLLLLPFAGPVWCFRLILERIREEADAVQHDEGRGFAELIDLSMRHKAGKLSDAEFAEQEAALLQRLSDMREYREELLQAEMDMAQDDLVEDDPDGEDEVYFDLDPDVADGDAFAVAALQDGHGLALDGDPVPGAAA